MAWQQSAHGDWQQSAKSGHSQVSRNQPTRLCPQESRSGYRIWIASVASSQHGIQAKCQLRGIMVSAFNVHCCAEVAVLPAISGIRQLCAFNPERVFQRLSIITDNRAGTAPSVVKRWARHCQKRLRVSPAPADGLTVWRPSDDISI